MDLSQLKDFIDLGGVFILALILIYSQQRVLVGIDEKLTKVLTLLSILVKVQTRFNGVEKVLGKDKGRVLETIKKAESSGGDS